MEAGPDVKRTKYDNHKKRNVNKPVSASCSRNVMEVYFHSCKVHEDYKAQFRKKTDGGDALGAFLEKKPEYQPKNDFPHRRGQKQAVADKRDNESATGNDGKQNGLFMTHRPPLPV